MNIKEIHTINLHILKTVDTVCKKNNIKYRLEAGTLLGAVRNQGFIPWDDDIDIVFLREEYEKFIVAFKKENLNNFVLDEVKYHKNFRDMIDRIFYTKEVYRTEPIYKKIYGGLYQYPFLDIFVLDKCKTNLMWNINILLIRIVYGLLMGHRQNLNYKKYNLIQQIQIFILAHIGKFFDIKFLYKLYYKITTKYNCMNKIKTLFYSTYQLEWIWNRDYITNIDREKKIIYTDFEDTKLPIVEDYENLLISLYGDYKKTPPINEQTPSHIDIGEY